MWAQLPLGEIWRYSVCWVMPSLLQRSPNFVSLAFSQRPGGRSPVCPIAWGNTPALTGVPHGCEAATTVEKTDPDFP